MPFIALGYVLSNGLLDLFAAMVPIETHRVDWPKWWRGEGHHFLEGFPLWGMHCRVIKHVRRTLALRDKTAFESAWGRTGYPILQCAFMTKKIHEIVRHYVAWPNHWFFPEDRAALIMGVIPGVWFDPEDPVEEIRSFFHVKGLREGDSCYYDIVLRGTIKECIGLFLSEPGGQGDASGHKDKHGAWGIDGVKNIPLHKHRPDFVEQNGIHVLR